MSDAVYVKYLNGVLRLIELSRKQRESRSATVRRIRLKYGLDNDGDEKKEKNQKKQKIQKRNQKRVLNKNTSTTNNKVEEDCEDDTDDNYNDSVASRKKQTIKKPIKCKKKKKRDLSDLLGTRSDENGNNNNNNNDGPMDPSCQFLSSNACLDYNNHGQDSRMDLSGHIQLLSSNACSDLPSKKRKLSNGSAKIPILCDMKTKDIDYNYERLNDNRCIANLAVIITSINNININGIRQLTRWVKSANYTTINDKKNINMICDAVSSFIVATIEEENGNKNKNKNTNNMEMDALDEEKNAIFSEIDNFKNNNYATIVIELIVTFIIELISRSAITNTKHIFDLLAKTIELSHCNHDFIQLYGILHGYFVCISKSFISSQYKYKILSFESLIIQLKKCKISPKSRIMWIDFIACCCSLLNNLKAGNYINITKQDEWDIELIHYLVELLCECVSMDSFKYLLTTSNATIVDDILLYLLSFHQNKCNQVIKTPLKSETNHIIKILSSATRNKSLISMLRDYYGKDSFAKPQIDKHTIKTDQKKTSTSKTKTSTKTKQRNKKKEKTKTKHENTKSSKQKKESFDLSLANHLKNHPEIVEKERDIAKKNKKNEEIVKKMKSIENDIKKIRVKNKPRCYSITMGIHYKTWSTPQTLTTWWKNLKKASGDNRKISSGDKRKKSQKNWKWAWSYDSNDKYVMCLRRNCKAYYFRPEYKKNKYSATQEWHYHNSAAHED